MKHIYDHIPMIELSSVVQRRPMTEDMPSPRIIKTHLPPTAFSRHDNVMAKRTKIIYGMRNPKDVLVSYYHHYRFELHIDIYMCVCEGVKNMVWFVA